MSSPSQGNNAFKQREEELVRIQEIGGVAGLSIEMSSKVDHLNGWRTPEYRQLHGLLPGIEFESHEDWLNRIHPDDRQEADQAFRDAINGSSLNYQSEYRIIRPIDGQIRWIHGKFDIERNSEGKATRLIGAHIDITELKSTRDALRRSESNLHQTRLRLGSVLETGMAGVFFWDIKTGLVTTDRSLKEYFSLPEHALTEGVKLEDALSAIHDDDRESVVQALNEAITTGTFSLEYRVCHPDGKLRWLSARGKVEYDTENRAVMLPGFTIDITRIKEAEEALRESEIKHRIQLEQQVDLRTTELQEANRKLEIALQQVKDDAAMIRGMADAAPDMVYVIDIRKLQVVFANRNMIELFGKSLKEIRQLGAQVFDGIVHPDDRASFDANIELLRHAADHEVLKMTLRLQDHEGNWRWVRTRRTVYKRDEAGHPTHVIGISQDISREVELRFQNRQLQREQNEMEEHQRQVLLNATLNAQEEERRRIAESLHNGLGQLLFGVKLSLANARKEAGDEIARKLIETEQMLAQAINTSRRISHELMPTIIEDYGLESAILDICRQWEDSLKIKCYFDGIPRQMDKYVELAIYRILQELAQNIIKHAEARNAEISLKAKGNTIEIIVRDNGKGFDTENIAAAGIGLRTIRNKVKLLKGSFKILSAPDSGTEIKVSIPFGTVNRI